MALAIVGILILALAVLTYISYHRDLNRARLRISSGGHVVNTPSGQIEYADVGNGPPLLVAHSTGGGFDQGLLLTLHLV
jgi:hypothetical protein